MRSFWSTGSALWCSGSKAGRDTCWSQSVVPVDTKLATSLHSVRYHLSTAPFAYRCSKYSVYRLIASRVARFLMIAPVRLGLRSDNYFSIGSKPRIRCYNSDFTVSQLLFLNRGDTNVFCENVYNNHCFGVPISGFSNYSLYISCNNRELCCDFTTSICTCSPGSPPCATAYRTQLLESKHSSSIQCDL